MNNENNTHTKTHAAPRTRFCDSIGFTGLLCLSLFYAFSQLLEFGSKF